MLHTTYIAHEILRVLDNCVYTYTAIMSIDAQSIDTLLQTLLIVAAAAADELFVFIDSLGENHGTSYQRHITCFDVQKLISYMHDHARRTTKSLQGLEPRAGEDKQS